LYNTWVAEVDALEAANFVDDATRLVQVSVTLYNQAANRWVIANYNVEFSRSGALYVSRETRELRITTESDILAWRIGIGCFLGFLYWWHLMKFLRETYTSIARTERAHNSLTKRSEEMRFDNGKDISTVHEEVKPLKMIIEKPLKMIIEMPLKMIIEKPLKHFYWLLSITSTLILTLIGGSQAV